MASLRNPTSLSTGLAQATKGGILTKGRAAGKRASFYSHSSAPGVVMAVGNTGEFLDVAADNVCTWMSSDAGLTWRDVAPKSASLRVRRPRCAALQLPYDDLDCQILRFRCSTTFFLRGSAEGESGFGR